MTHYFRVVAVAAVLTAIVAGPPLPVRSPGIDALRVRAEQGDAQAQVRLAVWYVGGTGDFKEPTMSYFTNAIQYQYADFSGKDTRK